jgi:pimeloyl-ACP methyl ester carboxylesterase
VTLALALGRPSRVGRLVLIGTGAGGPAYLNAPGALWNRTHPRFWTMAGLSILHLVWPARGPERLLNNLVHVESFHDRGQADVRPVAFADWFRRREGWTGWHWQARKLDYSRRLGQIAVPCLVLCGRHDSQYPLACSEGLAAGIPGARLVVFERSGHYPYIEERAAFEAALGSFLARRDRATVGGG